MVVFCRNSTKSKDLVESIENGTGIYNSENEEKLSLEKLKSEEMSKIISDKETSANAIALSFETAECGKDVSKVIDMLNKYGIDATFFVSGIAAAENPKVVQSILSSGNELGSLALSGNKYMDKESQEDLISNFSKANRIFEVSIGHRPQILKCRSTVYTDELLEASKASGYEYVLSNKNYISFQSFKNEKEVQGYIRSLKRGTILSIKLDDVLDEFEYDGEVDDDLHHTDEEIDRQKVTILEVVNWILKSITEQGVRVVKASEVPLLPEKVASPYYGESYTGDITIDGGYNNQNGSNGENNSIIPNFKEILKENKGNRAQNIKSFYTTQKAVAFTFRGITKEDRLQPVLDKLKEEGMNATFFVTKAEVENNIDVIRKLIDYGFEIGNGGITANSNILDMSSEEILKEIYETDKILKKNGIETKSYMPGYGYVDDEVMEAVSAARLIDDLNGYELVTYSKAPINTSAKDKTATEIVESYFNVNTYVSLSRGEIVYFRLDSDICEDIGTIPEIITLLNDNYIKNGYVQRFDSGVYVKEGKKLGYSVQSVGSLQDSKLRYNMNNYAGNKYPLYSEEEANQMLISNYIGNPNVSLDSFTEEEQSLIDRTGQIDTAGEDVVFLTFDDWGGDPVINEIMNVLDKHSVRGSFFVTARNVDINGGLSNCNPNLLRAIAEKGHDIVNHTYYHEVLSEPAESIYNSVLKSFNVLNNIVGDTGTVKPYFRPPTLYVERESLKAVFEAGAKYSISGAISTHDYEAQSSEEILSEIEKNIVPGTGNVVILHMNNQSFYTAEAVDKFLTKNENGEYGRKYKIVALSDYLGA